MDFWQSGGGVGGHGSAVVWLHGDAHTHTKTILLMNTIYWGGKNRQTDRRIRFDTETALRNGTSSPPLSVCRSLLQPCIFLPLTPEMYLFISFFADQCQSQAVFPVLC